MCAPFCEILKMVEMLGSGAAAKFDENQSFARSQRQCMSCI